MIDNDCNTIANTAVAMTSLELVSYINSERRGGEAVLQHRDFTAKVPRVSGDGVCERFRIPHLNEQNGQTYPMPALPKDLTIADTSIRRDDAGRYCLNDLHRAAGAHPNHRPGEWLRNKQTQELVAEMGGAEIPAGPVATVNDGLNNGTFVAKELVYAYAMWISPAFHLKVIRTNSAMLASKRITIAEHARLNFEPCSYLDAAGGRSRPRYRMTAKSMSAPRPGLLDLQEQEKIRSTSGE